MATFIFKHGKFSQKNSKFVTLLNTVHAVHNLLYLPPSSISFIKEMLIPFDILLNTYMKEKWKKNKEKM